ncbi:MAG: PKD domain-containing protein [Flavobacteriales bacterium]|nr:PKD domain-containing protein [Flavobacteriales bacterium]
MQRILVAILLMIPFGGFAQLTIEANTNAGCAPFGVILSVTSPAPASINNYAWSVTYPDNTVETATSAEYIDILSIPGDYTVSLSINNGSQSITETNFITVYGLPEVNFEVDVQEGCYPLCIEFTDLTTTQGSNIVEWSWDFGNGTTSALQNPSYCYQDNGVYSPIMSVEDEFGCYNDISIPGLITVLDAFPEVGFLPSTFADCNPPAIIEFENSSSGNGGLTSSWDFDDGFTTTTVDASDITHTFTAVGLYEVCLHVEEPNGCAADSCVLIDVSPAPTPSFDLSESLVCAGTEITFTDTSTPTPSSVSWDIDGDGFTDSTSPSFNSITDTEGVFNPTLTVVYSPGCSASSDGTQSLEVLQELVANFSADNTFACESPIEVNFTNLSSGPGILSYEWIINGVSQSTTSDYTHTFNAPGSYDVTLQVTNDSGCVSELAFADFVNINSLDINFNLPAIVCTEEVVELSNVNVNSFDPILELEWDFNEDGITDVTGNTPSYIYSLPGEYFVSVVVTTVSGCLAEVESMATILVQPDAQAEILSGPIIGCPGEPVEFCVETVEGLNYNWNFGDNTGWNLIGFPETCVQHDYQDTGYFDISLSLYNQGCGNLLVLEDYLYISGPVALFQAIEDCSDITNISFVDNSISADEIIWDFGDGSPLVYNDPNPQHQYASEGQYTVTLTASNNLIDCPDITTTTLNLVTEDIGLNFFPSEGCPGMNVNMLTPDQTEYEIWNIDFGNGTVLDAHWDEGLNRWQVYITTNGVTTYSQFSFFADFIPFINYSQGGFFDITINAIDWSGCATTTVYEDAIEVYNDFLFADFAINVIDDCDEVRLEFVPTGNFLDTWEWEFTDGTISTDLILEHVFTAPYDTTFGATFTAADNFGCGSTVSHVLDIVPPPIPSFNALNDPLCWGDVLNLENTSVGENLTYSWDFGDPNSGADNTSTLENPTHEYNENGSFTVCLNATNTAGCTQSVCSDNLVNILNPVAEASYTSNINNCLYGVSLFNETQGVISSSFWDYGDNQTGGGLNVFHTYPLGVFDVELVVVNDLGCSDTLVLPDILNLGAAVGQFTSTLDPISCAPFQTTFEAYNVADNSFTYFWEFDDGSGDGLNNTQTSHTYTEQGTYCPSLIMEDQNGCPLLIQCETPFTVEEFTITTSTPETVCFGQTSFFEANGATSYAWSDNTNVNELTNNTWELDLESSQTLSLTGFFEDCENTVDIDFTILDLPNPNLLLANEYCFDTGEFDLLLNSSSDVSGGESFTVNGLESSIFSSNQTPNQSYEVIYTLEDINGCVNADTLNVFIHPLPIVNLANTPDFCEGDPVVALQGGMPLGGNYTVNDDLATTFDPSMGAGAYQVNYIYLDQNNCEAQDSVAFDVNPLPLIDFSSDDVCFGNDATFINNSSISSGSIAQAQWDFGNATTSNDYDPQGVSYASPGNYQVTLSLTSTENCSASLSQEVNVLTSPEVNFNFEDACLDQLFNFSDASVVQAGSAVAWEWDINGIPIAINQNVNNYQFPEAGNYNLSLFVTSNEGCVDSLSQTVQVFSLPEVDFLSDEACAGVPITFINTSSVEGATITAYEWTIDGEIVSTDQNFTGSFSEPGDLNLNLVVSSDQACSASSNDTFSVYAAPEISFTQSADVGCELGTVQFEDMSSAEGSIVLTWAWEMNGVFISGLNTASFNPQNPGAYDLVLTVGTPQGCFADTLVESVVELFPSPIATYSLSSDNVSMLNPELTIVNETEDSVEQIFTLPNGQEFNTPSIDYTFLEPGDYEFTLWVENEFACADSVLISIPVEQVILVHVPNAFTPDSDGVNEVFVPVINNIEVDDYRFEIFNRWGEMIFASETPGEGWNGNVKGGEHYAMDGVYTYRLALREITTNEKREFFGHVTLIR